jgi:hypothetical protein
MSWKHHKFARILAIDPSSKGFGYAVLESGGRLIDWGVKEVPSRKPKAFVARVDQLIAVYDPKWLAVEDCADTARGERAQRLIESLLRHAHFLDIKRSIISRDELRSVLGLSEDATKQEIAEAIAALRPGLRAVLPKRRRLWTSEDERMNIFDAIGLAIATLHYEYRRS